MYNYKTEIPIYNSIKYTYTYLKGSEELDACYVQTKRNI